MIKVDNLLEGRGLENTPIEMVPASLQHNIMYQKVGHVFAGEEKAFSPENVDQEIIFVVAGNGKISVDAEDSVEIREGDRVTIQNVKQYLIASAPHKGLDFMITGVRVK